MKFILCLSVLCFIFIQSELKPVNERTLKLPMNIENGMNIIIEGILENDTSEISLTFSGKDKAVEEECHITLIPQSNAVHITSEGKKENVFFKHEGPYPTPFALQFSARIFEVHYLMDIYYELIATSRQPLANPCVFRSFDSIDSITVKGFPSIENVTFSFNRERNV